MSAADGTIIGLTQISGGALRDRAVNVVLLAEGFKSDERGDFETACGTFVDALRATRPYDELIDVLNVFRIDVASTDSGADDPVAAGGTGATARTFFDASFGANRIRRLLVCNNTTALTVAARHLPEFTVALVVVNSAIYGGSGGAVATYSLDTRATEIALHEMGHTAFGLADEYAFYASENESGHDRHPAAEPREPNVTTITRRDALKWKWAVAAATPLPTMSNPHCGTVDKRPSPVGAGTTGLFEGAHYFHCGVYRAEYACKMRELGSPFCRVCREVIRRRVKPPT